MIRNTRKYEKIDTYLSIILKLIPILIAIFFVGSVVFNISYFYFLNLEWLGMLSISDYYEGSIFSIFYLLILIATCLLFDFIKKIFVCIFDIFNSFFNINKRIIPISLKLCKQYFKQYFILFNFRKARNISFTTKRLYCLYKKEIQDLCRDLLSVICKTYKFLLKTLVLLFISAMIFSPLFLFYMDNKKLFVISIFTYLYFLLVNKGISNKIIALFVLFCIGMGNVGVYMSSQTRKNNEMKFSLFLNKIPISVKVNDHEYKVARIINKGVIAKDDSNLYFFKWEDIQYLSKLNLVKKKNDKK